MNLLTVVYGDKYLDMFNRGLLRSLSFRGNKQILYAMKSCWTIYTDDKSIDPLKRLIDAHLPELKVDLRSVIELRDHIDAAQSAVIKMIMKCLAEKSLFLMAPPDTIFGDLSLAGMVKAHKKEGDCVAVAHPRVLPSILTESFLPSLSNEELCTLAWDHLHKSWTDAEVGHINQNSWMGGVEWQRVDKKTIKVVHRLPTIYLCDFTKTDLDYFITVPGFGHYDHQWPSILVQTNRQQYVRSSDDAFIVEITAADKNVPPLVPGRSGGFWQSNPHNEHNARLPVTFRML